MNITQSIPYPYITNTTVTTTNGKVSSSIQNSINTRLSQYIGRPSDDKMLKSTEKWKLMFEQIIEEEMLDIERGFRVPAEILEAIDKLPDSLRGFVRQEFMEKVANPKNNAAYATNTSFMKSCLENIIKKFSKGNFSRLSDLMAQQIFQTTQTNNYYVVETAASPDYHNGKLVAVKKFDFNNQKTRHVDNIIFMDSDTLVTLPTLEMLHIANDGTVTYTPTSLMKPNNLVGTYNPTVLYQPLVYTTSNQIRAPTTTSNLNPALVYDYGYPDTAFNYLTAQEINANAISLQKTLDEKLIKGT
jgi:hypothetical protein